MPIKKILIMKNTLLRQTMALVLLSFSTFVYSKGLPEVKKHCFDTAINSSVNNDSVCIKSQIAEASDIIKALETLKINIFKFSLEEFLSKAYNMELYIDEYAKGKETKQIFKIRLGGNIVKDGDAYRNRIKGLSIYMKMKNDSVAITTFNVPGVMQCEKALNLYPVGKEKIYAYFPRPFVLKNIESNINDKKIPLVFYGSAWVDPDNGLARFCGEREIEEGSKESSLLADSPHYYIIGIKITKSDDKANDNVVLELD